jgi:hypothetical protein
MKIFKSESYVWKGPVLVGDTRVGVSGDGNVYDVRTILNNGSEGETGTYFELLLEARPDGCLQVRIPTNVSCPTQVEM